jgi:hypothetical protein
LTVKGLERLQRKLDLLPARVKQRIRAAMETGADEIGWTYGRAPKGSMSLATVESLGGDLTITIYAGDSEAYYARWIEFGTSAHIAGGKFAGAQIPAQPARPYFYVSFRANRKRVKSRITRAINKAAKEVAAGS